jgi:hypothetical protein
MAPSRSPAYPGLAYINRREALMPGSPVLPTISRRTVDVTEIRLPTRPRDRPAYRDQRAGSQARVSSCAHVPTGAEWPEFQNPRRSGPFDASTGAFYAEVHAERPKTEAECPDSVPGHDHQLPADRRREQDTGVGRAVAPGHGRPLDSTASHDPDAGDGISHVQWFRPSGEARQPGQATGAVPTGTNPYRLHVYDESWAHLTTGRSRL